MKFQMEILLTFKTVYGLAPQHLHNRCVASCSHTFRSSIHLAATSTCLAAPGLWNFLSSELRNITQTSTLYLIKTAFSLGFYEWHTPNKYCRL